MFGALQPSIWLAKLVSQIHVLKLKTKACTVICRDISNWWLKHLDINSNVSQLVAWPSWKLTAILPLKIGPPPKRNFHLPSIHVQVRTVSFREGTREICSIPPIFLGGTVSTTFFLDFRGIWEVSFPALNTWQNSWAVTKAKLYRDYKKSLEGSLFNPSVFHGMPPKKRGFCCPRCTLLKWRSCFSWWFKIIMHKVWWMTWYLGDWRASSEYWSVQSGDY